MVIVSPNVDFNESSTAGPLMRSEGNLDGLKNVFGVGKCTQDTAGVTGTAAERSRYLSEWESDEEILRLGTTKDEEVPNGPNPVVPLIPREPDACPHRHHCSEVERLMDSTGPLPTHERQRPRAAVGIKVGDQCASVGDTNKGVTRKYVYYKALLTAENTHINNEPTNVNEARERLDWPKWEAAMQEELNSLK